MPAMIFLCEQCGEKYNIDSNLVINEIYDQRSGEGPVCNTPQCGRELSPVISMKIEGASRDHKTQETEYHFYPRE